MTKTAVEIITSVERRRCWSAAEKEGLVAASLEPGVGVAAVARDAGIHPSQLYGWRRQLLARQRGAGGFAAVRMMPDASSGSYPGHGLIDIEFASGVRMRITGAVDPGALATLVAGLTRGGRR